MLCTAVRGGLWADRVGVDDNFFSLGGDSILSIQLVAAPAGAGYRITPREVFEHPTIAALAAVADAIASGRRGTETGDRGAPLTPIHAGSSTQPDRSAASTSRRRAAARSGRGTEGSLA